jgi:hypothetical protein
MPRALLVARARLHCAHHGQVSPASSHPWIRIDQSAVLVRQDVEGVAIDGCPNTIPPNTVKCSRTIAVLNRSESHWLYIGGQPIALSSVVGSVVCQPPLSAQFRVTSAGQAFVREDP